MRATTHGVKARAVRVTTYGVRARAVRAMTRGVRAKVVEGGDTWCEGEGGEGTVAQAAIATISATH